MNIERMGIALLAVTILLLLLAAPKMLLLVIGVIITAGFTVVQARLKAPVEVSPVFFFSIIITNYLGLGYCLFFIILGAAIPALLSGRGKDVHLFIFWLELYLLNIFSLLVAQNNIAGTGAIMSVIEFLASTALQVGIGMLAGEVLLRTASFFIANMAYFLLLWNLYLKNVV